MATTFEPSQLPPEFWGRWTTMDSGDIDHDGDVDVTPGAGNTPRGIPETYLDHYQELWNRNPPVLILENTLR